MKSEQKRPKVLILTMSVGDGHKVPAQSVHAALAAAYPDIAARVVEPALELGLESFQKGLVASWHFCLEHPRLFQLIYSLTKRRYRLVRAFETLTSRRIVPRLAELMEREKPDFVFSTHSIPANVLGRLNRGKASPIPTAVLITDAFEAHAMWLAGTTDFYIFFDKDRTHDLRAAGIREEQIKIMGFPLRPAFSRAPILHEKPRTIVPGLPSRWFLAVKAAADWKSR